MSNNETNIIEAQTAVYQTSRDLVSAVLIVSVLVNLTVFIAWLLVTADPNTTLYLVTK